MKHQIMRLLSSAALCGVFMAGTGCNVTAGLTGGPSPEHDGTVKVDGLQAAVEVLVDSVLARGYL